MLIRKFCTLLVLFFPTVAPTLAFGSGAEQPAAAALQSVSYGAGVNFLKWSYPKLGGRTGTDLEVHSFSLEYENQGYNRFALRFLVEAASGGGKSKKVSEATASKWHDLKRYTLAAEMLSFVGPSHWAHDGRGPYLISGIGAARVDAKSKVPNVDGRDSRWVTVFSYGVGTKIKYSRMEYFSIELKGASSSPKLTVPGYDANWFQATFGWSFDMRPR